MATLKKCTISCNSATKRLTPILEFFLNVSQDGTQFTACQTMFIEAEKIYNRFQELHSQLKEDYDDEEINDLELLVVKLDKLYLELKLHILKCQT